MLDVFLDSLKDSAIVFAFLLVVYIGLSFLEPKLARFLERSHKWSPLVGISFGLIPQCGFSVLAADLYQKKHITIGTLVGVFIATSDEAIPIFLASVNEPKKMLMILPLLGIKFLVGLGVAYLLDFIFRKKIQETITHQDDCHCEEVVHIGCCGHTIDFGKHEEHEHSEHNHEHGAEHNPEEHSAEHSEDENHEHDEPDDDKKPQKKIDKEFLHHHLGHPLVHSLKILAYIFIINFIFGTIIYYVGEDKITGFLASNKFLSPLFSVLVGFIPNCASSVLISDLYLIGGISFGACVGGLCVNAGLGLFVLFKNVKNIKENLVVASSLLIVGLAVGYIASLIEWTIQGIL